jgi:hypothetical protein
MSQCLKQESWCSEQQDLLETVQAVGTQLIQSLPFTTLSRDRWDALPHSRIITVGRYVTLVPIKGNEIGIYNGKRVQIT